MVRGSGWWIAAVVAAVLIASCSDAEPLTDPALTDRPVEEAGAAETGGAEPGAAEAGVAEAGSTTTLVPPTPTDPPRPEPPSLGELVLPCGSVEFGPESEATGVGVDTIVIATGTDRGGAHVGDAGLGMPEAVAAMADVCNGFGGVADRAVVVRDDDAAVTEVAARAEEQCQTVAAVVGAPFLDPLAALETWNACSMPVFDGRPVSFVRPDPPPLIAHRSARQADPGVTTVAVLSPETFLGQVGRTILTDGLAAEGFTVVAASGYPVSRAPDWSAIAADLAAVEPALVHVVGSCRSVVVPLVAALSSIEAEPVVVSDHRAYDPACVQEAAADGVGLDNVRLELPFLPVEDGDAAPTVLAHAAVFAERSVPITGDALLGASAFWSFATAAGSCPDLDRGCLAAAAAVEAVAGWDAGGLHLGFGDTRCRVVVGVADGGYVRLDPTQPGTFSCR